MAPSPLRNIPVLAAAATECRITGMASVKRKTSPTKKKCSVRVHGDLVVRYVLRRVGAPQTTALHAEAPRRFDQHFDLLDPDTFFGSYTACRDAIHGMLTQTPLLREFDLGADNWEVFTPGIVATIIVGNFRHGTEQHGGVALGIRIGVRLAITIRIVYNEPKAVLLASTHTIARYMPPWVEWCCICMEDLAARAGAVAASCPGSTRWPRARCAAATWGRTSSLPPTPQWASFPDSADTHRRNVFVFQTEPKVACKINGRAAVTNAPAKGKVSRPQTLTLKIKNGSLI